MPEGGKGEFCGDSVPGFPRIRYPRVAHQRCWVHKMRNILDKVRKREYDAVKTDAQASSSSISQRAPTKTSTARKSPAFSTAGWDATFSAPKSVSHTALVGRDDRVREAHRESVRVALRELERYTQARIGKVHAPETTGQFIAAHF